MNTKDYQKMYKQSYLSTNKIITFPIHIDVYEDLNKRALYFNLSSNSFAKKILTSFLQNTSLNTLSIEEREFINEYMHISRGIANNINQIAHKTNI